ncbi:hypothetical protein [Ktedonobacter racemifer]|uniref:hypothetical protein n=1 Tax=Ktedonobacter racemifer TaxID=363277 RepID=UPI0012FC8999|nr:hypothetical protein [Ktedonobacter racemifer]
MSQEQLYPCPACGHPLADDADRCPQCNANISERRKAGCFIGVIGLACVGIAFFGYFTQGNPIGGFIWLVFALIFILSWETSPRILYKSVQ